MSIDDLKFKTSIMRHGIERTNRFRVTIPLPNQLNAVIEQHQEQNGGLLPDWLQETINLGSIVLGGVSNNDRSIQFTCLGTALSGTQMAMEESKINGHTMKFSTGIERESTMFNFLVSNDFYEKKIFDKWMNFIVDEKTRKVSYFDDYTVDITVEALNANGQVVYTLNMIDSHPTTVDTYRLNKQSLDSYGMLSVNFQPLYITNDELPKDKSHTLPGNLGGLLDGLTSGNLEQAAYSARMLVIQAKNGEFTGEAAAIYSKINEISRQSIGFSITEVEKMKGGLNTMVELSSNITDLEKISLSSILDGF